jgi:hypothetical protein
VPTSGRNTSMRGAEYIRWRKRVITSNRGRGACTCSGFTYRESRSVELVRGDRVAGKRIQVYLGRLGTIRSCCLAHRPKAAIEAVATEFLVSCAAKLEELAEAGAIPAAEEALERLLRKIYEGLTDLLPERWPDVAVIRDRRWRRRRELAQRRGQEIQPRFVAQWVPYEQWVFSRGDYGPDHEWHRFPLKQPAAQQRSARKIEGLLVNLKGESSLTDETKEGIKVLFGAPGYAGLNSDVAGALKDLLAAREPERFCEAKLELRAVNNGVMFRAAEDMIHKLIPLEEQATAFDRLVECVQGLPPVFEERLVDDLEIMRKPETFALKQSFAARAERQDNSKLTRKEWAGVNHATSGCKDVPKSMAAAKSRRQRAAYRDFHHLRCQTQTQSYEAAGGSQKFATNDSGPMEQAMNKDSLLNYFSMVEALIAVHHHFGDKTQAETAAIALPQREPEAGRRAVSRIYARIRPKIEEFQRSAA